LKFCLLLSGCLLSAFSIAEVPKLPAKRMATPPILDGVIEAKEWESAASTKGLVDGLTSKPVVDDTDIWIGYDDQAIFVAFYAHDSQPQTIVGREVKPGAEFNGEDVVGFIINPQGTRTWDGRCVFRVNPLNTQNEQISGGRASKREWRGEWTSATKRVQDGWCVEMRIPWKMLNYPSGEHRSMDINFGRFQPRTNIESKWADNTVQEHAELNGIWTDVSPPKASSLPRPKFLVYAAPEYESGKLGFRSGLDVKYPFTPQFTGIASFNPDFKNIESQIAGIDFTRTERYLDEARPFFNEGGDYFQVGDYPFGFAQMFYSRRIESFDWGAKAFGQLSPNLGVGALMTVDTGDRSAGVVRLNQNFGPRKSANVWFTGTESAGKSTAASGLSASIGRGNYSADLNLSTSRGDSDASPTAGSASASYSVPHWFTLLKYQWIPPDFSSPLAYVPWTDKRGAYCFNEYNMDYRSGPTKSLHWDVYGDYYEEYDGSQQEKGVEVSASTITRRDLQIRGGISRYVFFNEPENLQNVGLVFNKNNRYKTFGVSYNWGTRSGDPTEFFSAHGSYRLMRGLDIGASWNALSYLGHDRQTILTLGYEMGPYDSISGRFVAHNGHSNAYAAYRHGGGSGVEYYVIVGDPNAERWRSRVSVKLVWAF
jgi:hypothetical protein